MPDGERSTFTSGRVYRLKKYPVVLQNNTAFGVCDPTSSGGSWPITRFNTLFAASTIECACFGIISSQLTQASPSSWCRTVELFARSSHLLTTTARITSTVFGSHIMAAADLQPLRFRSY